MRFGRHHSTPAEEPTGNEPWAISTDWSAPDATPGRELFVRFARKNGRIIATLRAVDQGGACVVEAQVHPNGSTQLVQSLSEQDLVHIVAEITQLKGALNAGGWLDHERTAIEQRIAALQKRLAPPAGALGAQG